MDKKLKSAVLISLLFIVLLQFTPLVGATEIFSDGFETGDFSAWTGTHGSPSVVGSPVRQGSYAMKSDALGEYVYETFGSSYAEIYIRGYFYLGHLDGQYNIFDLYGTGGRVGIFHLMANGNARFLLKTAGGDVYVPSFGGYAAGFTIENWYCIEVHWVYDGSVGGGEFWVDGDLGGSDFAHDTDGNGEFNRFFIGNQWTSDTAPEVYVDCVVAADAYIGPEGPENTYYLDYSGISFNSTMLGTNNQMTSLWSSNDTLDTYTFEWNFTETMTADSPVSFTNSTPPQYSPVTKDLGTNMTKYQYVIMWRINVTTTNSETNSTGLQYFTLHGINITYTVSENATLRIDGTPTTNSTVTYPYGEEVEALAVVNAGSSFTDFDYNGTSYTNNPSTITYSATNYLSDNFQTFELTTGEGGTGGINSLTWFLLSGIVILFIGIPASLIMLMRKRR